MVRPAVSDTAATSAERPTMVAQERMNGTTPDLDV
jgi:hypothetical protein